MSPEVTPLRQARPWADLVVHVLAHVQGLARFPSGLWNPAYVREVERRLGSASERTLAEDTQVLAQAVTDHEMLSRLHWLACLFRGLDAARGVATTDLSELSRAEVDMPAALAGVLQLGPIAEVLRAAALLEAEHWERLPLPQWDMSALEAHLLAATRLSPRLGSMVLHLSASLGLRGRVMGNEIWLGVPEADAEPSVEHVAMQAAHEATVSEVAALQREAPVSAVGQHEAEPLREREVEHVALLLLSRRARRQGQSEAHARWLSHLAGLPPLSIDALRPAARAALTQLESQD